MTIDGSQTPKSNSIAIYLIVMSYGYVYQSKRLLTSLYLAKKAIQKVDYGRIQFRDSKTLLRPSFNALKLSSLVLSCSLDGKFSNKFLFALSVM